MHVLNMKQYVINEIKGNNGSILKAIEVFAGMRKYLDENWPHGESGVITFNLPCRHTLWEKQEDGSHITVNESSSPKVRSLSYSLICYNERHNPITLKVVYGLIHSEFALEYELLRDVDFIHLESNDLEEAKELVLNRILEFVHFTRASQE